MSERIRKGMWVRLGDRIGIVAAKSSVEADVHLVDGEGVTETVVVVALSSISQAAFDDIPAVRRPTADVAEKLGYL